MVAIILREIILMSFKCYWSKSKILTHQLTMNHFLNSCKKSKQESYEKLVEMSRNNEYTTGSLFDYLYHQNYYDLIGIDLSGQTNSIISQQINFTSKLE